MMNLCKNFFKNRKTLIKNNNIYYYDELHFKYGSTGPTELI